MHGNDSNFRNEIFAERLRTVEVSNEFQKATLQDISQTLKGVVETQAKLAHQKGEISSISSDLRSTRDRLSEQETTIKMMESSLERALLSTKETDKELKEIRRKVAKNETFVKTMTYGLTAIVVPVLIWAAQHFFSFIMPIVT